MARRFGANMTIDYRETDPVAAIKRATGGRGADVAIEALGQQATFENALRAIRPVRQARGAVRSALRGGLGDQKIVTSLCPGGKERMRRLMAMIVNRRVDLTPLVTHRFGLADIESALDVFAHQRGGVMKVALYRMRRGCLASTSRRSGEPRRRARRTAVRNRRKGHKIHVPNRKAVQVDVPRCVSACEASRPLKPVPTRGVAALG